MKNSYLITGGYGFIGSSLVRLLLKKKFNVINIDKITYASIFYKDLHKEFSQYKNYKFFNFDISKFSHISNIFKKNCPKYIINFAAETHVDNSIEGPKEFIETNILGTFNLLQCVLKYVPNSRFIHISTDEVFGELSLKGKFSENSPYAPSSPYSASKASADHLALSWSRTYNLDVIVTNCSNNYGPYQHYEKLIPTIVKSCLNEENIPIYGDGSNIRDWLYVDDHTSAIFSILKKGKKGEKYNIGTNNEMTNLKLAKKICHIFDKIIPLKNKKIKNYSNLIKFVKDRPGHDFRYAIDNSKLTNEIKWKSRNDFNKMLIKTIKWYIKKNQA